MDYNAIDKLKSFPAYGSIGIQHQNVRIEKNDDDRDAEWDSSSSITVRQPNRGLCLDLLRLGSSMIAAQVFLFLQITMTVAAAGRIGRTEQAGIGLAISFFNVVGIALSRGLSATGETFFSQAYGSPGNKKMVGIFLQRSLVFAFLSFLVVAALGVNSDVIFDKLGQGEEAACIARRYLIAVMPGLFALYVYRLMIAYLRIQDAYWPIIWSTVAGFVVAAISFYVFHKLKFGVVGIAMANNVGYFTMALLTVGYTVCSRLYEKTWDGWSLKIFDDWYPFVKLGGAGILLSATEYIFAEVITIIAGTIGPAELSAQTIGFQVLFVCCMAHFGFSIACSVRVGTSLGANEPQKAKRVIKLSFFLAMIPISISGIPVTVFRHEIATLFSRDQATIQHVDSLLLYCAGMVLIDMIYAMLNSAMRGSARQAIASVVNFFGMYCIGIPILLTMKFTDTLSLSIPYMWLTLAGTEVVMILALLVILARTDWTEQARLAYERVSCHVEQSQTLDEQKPLLSRNDNSGTGPRNTRLRRRLNIALKMTIIFVVVVCSLMMCAKELWTHPFTPNLVKRNSMNFTHMNIRQFNSKTLIKP